MTRPAIPLAAALVACLACGGTGRDAPSDSTAAVTAPGAADSSSVSGSNPECAPSPWAAEGDTSAATRPRVTRHAVNGGTDGMFSQIRWAHSPDRCALLVVQDPAAVEAEPVPNGFLLVSERGGRVFQRDSAWDVSPSPDWKRLAFAVAHGMQPRGPAESLSTAEWRRFAQRVGVDAPAVRRGAFSCSGMTYWFCVARLYVAELADPVPGGGVSRDTVRALDVLAGWRVRWRPDGRTILAGTGPRGSQDHDPPASWLVVDALSGQVNDTLSAADSASGAPVAWATGPMLTYGVTVDLESRNELPIDGGSVVSEGGWIDVRRVGAGGAASSFRVGPGRALAATRGGRFIAAIIPTGATSEREWAYEVVVYQIARPTP